MTRSIPTLLDRAEGFTQVRGWRYWRSSFRTTLILKSLLTRPRRLGNTVPPTRNPLAQVNGLSGDFVTPFPETASGDIRIGVTGGLAKFENGGFKTFTAADGMAGSFVRPLYLTLADKHQKQPTHGELC